MPKITWDSTGQRYYETGVDRGVLFASGFDGVPWNGLVGVTEAPTGGTAESYYIDGSKYISVSAYEEFAATIEAFTYPDEFNECEGIQEVNVGLYATSQPRKSFDLAYRTIVSDDLQSSDYKLHLVYNAIVAPTQRGNKTNAADTMPMTFSWPITTTPIVVSGRRNTAHLVLDSRFTNSDALAAIEDILYGTDETSPRMPSLFDLNTIINEHVTVLVIDHGDGSYTVSGPDADVYTITEHMWAIWIAGEEVGADSNGYAITPPGGYTSRASNGAQASNPTVTVADNQSAVGGDTGAKTGTCTSASYWSGLQIALAAQSLSYRATPQVVQSSGGVSSFSVNKQSGTVAGDEIFIFLKSGGINSDASIAGFYGFVDSEFVGAVFHRTADGTEGSAFTINSLPGHSVTAAIVTIVGPVTEWVIGPFGVEAFATSFAVPSVKVPALSTGAFQVDWPSAVAIDTDTFRLSSL